MRSSNTTDNRKKDLELGGMNGAMEQPYDNHTADLGDVPPSISVTGAGGTRVFADEVTSQISQRDYDDYGSQIITLGTLPMKLTKAEQRSIEDELMAQQQMEDNFGYTLKKKQSASKKAEPEKPSTQPNNGNTSSSKSKLFAKISGPDNYQEAGQDSCSDRVVVPSSSVHSKNFGNGGGASSNGIDASGPRGRGANGANGDGDDIDLIHKQSNRIRRLQYILFATVLLVVIAVVVIVVFATSFGGDSSPSESSTLTPPTTPAPTAGGDILFPTPATATPVETMVPTTTPPNTPSITMDAIQARGTLRCGFLEQIGFSTRTENNTAAGFQVDLCRAIGAAIFGEDGHTEPLFTDSLERFKVLQNNTIDVSLAHVTKTLERDICEVSTQQGYEFSIPYLYNELRYGGLPEHVQCLNNQTDPKIANLTSACVADLKLCVLDGSTHLDIVTETWPTADIVVAPLFESKFTFFRDGRCSVIVGEKFDIVEETVRRFGYTGPYLQSEDALSLEPLAVVTREGDAWFSDFVNWVIHGLMVAEETGSDGVGLVQVFGRSFETMFLDAYAVVGHYGDIYEAHLEPLIPRSPVNEINPGDSGLIKSLPFGDFGKDTPITAPAGAPGTLQRVFDRTLLRCGVARVKGFAIQDPITQEWSGLDVDYCRALSAAIFSGDPTRVLFIELSSTRRFIALANDEVDVLSRFTTVTLPRDVKEPASGTGFTFTDPTFYDGLVFGGIPPYDECVLNLNTVGDVCENLVVCVEQNTTFYTNVYRLFPERSIVDKITNEATQQGLISGDCNMIAGGRADVAEETIRDVGRYSGEYKIVPRVFAKDPLALVTRDDDPQWSAFVAAIVSATFYAEEINVTQVDTFAMPITQLFGTQFNRMFRNAISAVGNYGEIYERNVESFIARDGLNRLNVRPFGPQHYPYPTIG